MNIVREGLWPFAVSVSCRLLVTDSNYWYFLLTLGCTGSSICPIFKFWSLILIILKLEVSSDAQFASAHHYGLGQLLTLLCL